MKNHPQNILKSKKIDFHNKKKSVSSSENDNKINLISSPKKSDNKKEIIKNDKNIESKENNLKFTNNNNIKSIPTIQNNININSKNLEKNKENKNLDNKLLLLLKSENNQNINDKEIQNSNQIPSINININENKTDNINNSSPSIIKLNSISYIDNINNKLKENDQKLKNSLQAFKNINKKNDNTSLNTLYKLRSILLNLLKDKEQDLEYSKFITEKKLKYMIKNKERSENRIKILDSELNVVDIRKEELEKILGEIYCFYDEEELKEDIKRFENSNEVKSGKFSKTLEQLETMKKMLPFVSEYGKVKDKRNKILGEKKELEKIIKNSSQTISILNNYYKNIKKKINEQIG